MEMIACMRHCIWILYYEVAENKYNTETDKDNSEDRVDTRICITTKPDSTAFCKYESGSFLGVLSEDSEHEPKELFVLFMSFYQWTDSLDFGHVACAWNLILLIPILHFPRYVHISVGGDC